MSKVGNAAEFGGLPPVPETEQPVQNQPEQETEEFTEVQKSKFTPTIYDASPDFPEAGGICWTELHGVKITNGVQATFRINVTGRGKTAKDAFANLVELITDGKMSPAEFREVTKLSLTQHVPEGKAAPAPIPPLSTVIGTGTAVTPPPAAATMVQTATTLGGQVSGGVFDIVAMDVTPRADGKVKLDFYGNEHGQPRNKYPSVYWVTDIDHAIEKLSKVGGFTAEHMKTMATYNNLSWKLHWVPGGMNSKGNPYKNVDFLEPA